VVIGEHDGFVALHRPDDWPLIRRVLSTFEPRYVVELGTHLGGFASFLAEAVRPWGGWVVTVDKVRLPESIGLEGVHPNLRFWRVDVLDHPVPWITKILSWPDVALYCDDGNKERELELYAPFMGPRGLVGVHDWGTETRPEVACPLMDRLGFQMVFREDFEKLAHPEWYPHSMTRFWRRP